MKTKVDVRETGSGVYEITVKHGTDPTKWRWIRVTRAQALQIVGDLQFVLGIMP